MTTITKVLSDTTVMTPTVDPTVRARTLVMVGNKLKPYTRLNVFFSGVNVNAYFTPCTRVVITTSNAFAGYTSTAKVQTSNIADRTTSVDSYDVLDRGDVVVCTGGTAVVVSDETIFNKTTQTNQRVLYVSNVKGTLSGTITNRQNTATGTVVSTSAGDFQTNSRGNFYGALTIPSNTFRSGSNTVTVSDGDSEASGAATTYAKDGYLTQGAVHTFDRYLSTQQYEENTVVNTIVRTVNAGPPPGWGDPLAQSFVVPKEYDEGCFITSVDLYFATGTSADVNPVECQIVEVLNGYPTQDVLPYARSIMPAGLISFNATGLTPTRFYFQSLVKLKAGGEYAIKILSNSTKYKVWTSFIGDNELINPAKVISEQPYLGSLFKSQNNSAWTAEQLQDLTFKINYAKFNTNTIGRLKLVETPTANYHTLPPNPFRITDTQTKVAVNHPSHGLVAGLYVTYIGSTVSAFNATFAVTSVVDSDTYIITMGAAQTATDLVGGGVVKAEKTIKYDGILVNGVSVGATYGVKLFAKLAGATALDTINTELSDVKKIDLMVDKFVHTTINRTNHLSGAASFQFNAEFSSVNTAISPVIDLDALSVYLYGSKINNPSSAQVDYDIDGGTIVTGSSDVSFTAATNIITIPSTADYTKITLGAWIKVVSGSTLNVNKTGYISNIDTSGNTLTIVGDSLVDEASQSAVIAQYNYVSEVANGGSAESRYIAPQVNLKDTATGFRVIFDANIPVAAEIDMYYRANISSSTDRLSEKLWINYPITYKKSAVETEFTEFEYNITSLEAFDVFQFKFVFRSTNAAATPKMKNLRIIAHG